MGFDPLFHHRSEDVLLGGEIEIDGPLGDPGPGGDVVQPRGGEPLFSEDLEGRRNDLLWPVGLAAFELGFSSGKPGRL
jgi:hypothetical protein